MIVCNRFTHLCLQGQCLHIQTQLSIKLFSVSAQEKYLWFLFKRRLQPQQFLNSQWHRVNIVHTLLSHWAFFPCIHPRRPTRSTQTLINCSELDCEYGWAVRAQGDGKVGRSATDIRGPRKMSLTDFDQTLFHLMKHLQIYWMACHKMWNRHVSLPVDSGSQITFNCALVPRCCSHFCFWVKCLNYGLTSISYYNFFRIKRMEGRLITNIWI